MRHGTGVLAGLAGIGLGLLAACAPAALYEPDAVFFAGRTAPDARAAAAPRAPAVDVGGGGVVRAPKLPPATDPDVVARFLVTTDGPLAVSQSFTPGTLRPEEGVALRIGDSIALVDLAVLATHPDGTVRHAVIHTTVPSGATRRPTPALVVRLP